MKDINRTISLKFAQKIYDVANYETKKFLEQIFPKVFLEIDMENMGKLIGNAHCDYEDIITVKGFKMIYKNSEKVVTEELYNEILKLPDNILLLLLWVEPRYDYYPRDYINGVYVLENRYDKDISNNLCN